MKDIAIYGAGGYGREVYCLIESINNNNKWNFLGFFDDGKEIGSSNEYGKIIGGIKEVNEWNTPLDLVIAIGNPNNIQKIVESINNQNIDYPNIIADDVLFLDRNNISMGKGNIIGFGCFISCNISIGNFNILNNYITVGHDAQIGNYNAIMPAVRISGAVKIGDNNFFGVSSVVLQLIRIGYGVVIGANSVLIRKPKDNSTYVGNPATIL